MNRVGRLVDRLLKVPFDGTYPPVGTRLPLGRRLRLVYWTEYGEYTLGGTFTLHRSEAGTWFAGELSLPTPHGAWHLEWELQTHKVSGGGMARER